MESFEKISYQIEENACRVYASRADIRSLLEHHFVYHSVDQWRQKRFFKLLYVLANNFPRSTWLTVGDYMGRDAFYIQKTMPQSIVCASDIDDSVLRVSKELGYIQQYKKENAEFLSFPDKCFDFVLCKEAFHHFPRPYIALYEMLRVAKKGIVLLEPLDQYLSLTHKPFANFIKGIYMNLKHSFKFAIGQPSPVSEYESSNFVYSISPRELMKVTLGLYLEMMAYRGINDHYHQNSSDSECARLTSSLFRRVWAKIKLHDILTSLGFKEPTLMMAIIFKNSVSAYLESQLIHNKYKIFRPPLNSKLLDVIKDTRADG